MLAVASAQGADEPLGSAVSVFYDNGLFIESGDGNWSAHPELRAQLRYSTVDGEVDSAGPEDLFRDESSFSINRARFKLGGVAYRPWLAYYTEIELANPRLLDLRFELTASEALGVRIGQYKVLYNRARVDSSGKQQFVERSIVTFPFTLDRQQGATVLGRVFAGSPVDSNYYLGAFTGTGRGGGSNDGGRPMLVGRWQLNLLRRKLGFSQSDIERTEKTAATLALGAASHRSRFTRFSSDGGGQLPGFEDGEPGQYDTRQWMGEFALKSRGLSVQAEYHYKTIDDRLNEVETRLSGYYAQAGYFFSESWPAFPPPLELAVRYAQVDGRGGVELPDQREATLVGNWFFAGHRNKLSVDISRLDETSQSFNEAGWRLRLQWDISI